MLNRFLNILFPESCPLCQRPSTKHKTAPICPDCWDAVRPYNGAICKRCGAPLVSEASLACGECLKDEPAFTHARCFGLHDGALKKAINLFKFHGIKRLSKPLSEKIFHMELPGADMVLPVPLYKKRLRERGFNQSALLGKYVAKRLGVPLNLSSLVRNRDTRPQVGLSAKERKKNIRNAFEIREQGVIKGRRVLLIDDVFTTGATARECSKVLNKAGAQEVFVITLSHGVLD